MIITSKEQLSKDEMKIIAELQKNSNEEIETIAKRVGFSKQKVRRMIKQLEERRIIWGYTAIIDPEQSNYKQFMILIKRTKKPIDKKNIDKIDTMQLEDIALPIGVIIESSFYTHGNYDWIILFTARDINQVKIFCNVLYQGFPGIIEKIDIQQILYTVRKHFIFNPDRKKLHDLME